jgi:hypothetical protein
MKADVEFYARAILSVLVITDPITRGIFFKMMTSHRRTPDPRWARNQSGRLQDRWRHHRGADGV